MAWKIFKLSFHEKEIDKEKLALSRDRSHTDEFYLSLNNVKRHDNKIALDSYMSKWEQTKYLCSPNAKAFQLAALC